MRLQVDDIGFGGYLLRQDADAFCYGIDAVLLADFSVCSPGETVVELGSGNGVVPLIIDAKYHPAKIIGIEKQTLMCALAQENARENQVDDHIEFRCIDVVDVPREFPAGFVDLVCSNPPYMAKGSGLTNPSTCKQIARHESTASLADFMKTAAYLLKPGGRLTMVHRPFRLADLFASAMKYGLEPKMMRMIVPKPGEAANIVLLQFIKGAGRELTVLPQLCVRNEDGTYTRDLLRIYGK